MEVAHTTTTNHPFSGSRSHRFSLALFILLFLTLGTTIAGTVIQNHLRHAEWKQWHETNWKEVNRALAGKRANGLLPSPNSLALPKARGGAPAFWSSYSSLLLEAHEDYKERTQFKREASDTIEELVSIGNSLETVDGQGLMRLRTEVLDLEAKTQRMKFRSELGYSVELRSTLLQGNWAERWPGNELSFDLEHTSPLPPKDILYKGMQAHRKVLKEFRELARAESPTGEETLDFSILAELDRLFSTVFHRLGIPRSYLGEPTPPGIY